MSETAKVRGLLSGYCKGNGVDIGFGGDPIVPWAICFDLPQPYTHVGSSPQNFQGDARELPFKDRTLDWVYSSHLIEDFYYHEQVEILDEWIRVLKVGGLLVLCAPNQQRYLATEKPGFQNAAHKEADYSLVSFKDKVWTKFHNIRLVQEWDDVAVYSWCLVARRVS